jgi:hypothetical protein
MSRYAEALGRKEFSNKAVNDEGLCVVLFVRHEGEAVFTPQQRSIKPT